MEIKKKLVSILLVAAICVCAVIALSTSTAAIEAVSGRDIYVGSDTVIILGQPDLNNFTLLDADQGRVTYNGGYGGGEVVYNDVQWALYAFTKGISYYSSVTTLLLYVW